MNDESFGSVDGYELTLYDQPVAPADTRTDEQQRLDAFRFSKALHIDSAKAPEADVRGASAVLERDFARRANLGTVQTDLLLGRGAEKDPRAVLRKMQDFYRSGDPRNLWTDERREAEDAAARGVDALYALASKKAHTAWWRNIGDPLDRAADEASRRAGRDRPIDKDKFDALMGSGDPELDAQTTQSLRGAQALLSRRRDLEKAANDAAARRNVSDDYIAAGQALSDFEREHADELAAASALVGKWHGKADKALTGAQYLAGLRAAQPDLMAAAVLSSGILKSPVSAAILQNARDSRPGHGGVAESLDLSFSASDKAEWLSLPKEDREIITPILQAYVNPRALGRVPVFGAVYEGFLEAGKAATNIGFQAAHTAESLLRRTVMDGADVQKWEEDWAELQEMRETATKKSENHWLPTDWAIGAMSQAPYMFGASLPRAGIALITAQAATDYISQVARDGGDVQSWDTVVEALTVGAATAVSEKMEADIFGGARKLTPLERIRVYDCLKASNLVGRMLGDTAGELTQEAFQDALMGAAVAAKVDRDWVPAMAQGAWEAIREGYGDFLVLGAAGVGTQALAQRHGALSGAQGERVSEFLAPIVKDILTAKASGQIAPLPDMEAWKANMGDIADKFLNAGGLRGGGVKFLEDLGFRHDAAVSVGYAVENVWRAVERTGSREAVSDFFGGREIRSWQDILSDAFPGAEVSPAGENAYVVRQTIRNGDNAVETETTVELGEIATDWSVIEQRDESGAPTAEAQGMAASVVQGLKQQDRANAVTEADVLAMTGEELRRFVEAKDLANPGIFRMTSGGASVDSDQLAALAGTIRFNPDLDPVAFLHEAGHAFLAYADKAGILSEQDFAALRAMFGEARTATERVNEEAFSDALRDAMAGRIRWTDQTIFERIRDAIVRLLDKGAELLRLRRDRRSAAEAARDSAFEQAITGNVRGIPMVAASQGGEASPSGAATATPSETPPSAPPAPAPEPNPSENLTGSESPDSAETPARPRRAPTEWTAVTPDGSMRLSGDWVVVDASTLLASSDPGYDQALQPRDRSTMASDSQVHAIATALDPARLADSPTTDTGAPLVSADGMVLSGNGRTLAIRAAYASGLAGAYAESVRARASEMGLAVPDSMRAPVLARRLSAETSNEDLVRAAELSNRPQILSRNEAETAEADAATILSGGFMDLLQPGDNGELLGEANRAFMDAFINATGDQGLRTADGFPTEAAQKRVRRAVLAALFHDIPNKRDLIRAAVEDAEDLRATRELAGLMRGAPAILRSAAARPAYDLRGEIGIALADYLDFKRQGGGDINAYLAQGQLFDPRPPEVSAVLREIGERQNATAISDFLQDYARRAEAQAAEGQDTFAFFVPPSKLDLIDAAAEATLPEGTSRSPAEYAPPPYRRGTAVLPGPDAKPVAASQVDAQGRPTTKVRMLPPGAWNLLRAPYDVRRAPAPSAQDNSGRGLGISDPPPTGHSDIFPHFQGNKTEMAARTTQAIRRTMSRAERAHYDTIVDYFGGGGCWGLYHALENFPGVRRLVVNEFDPDRLGKIRLLHEHDGEVADTAGAFLLDDGVLGKIREAAQNSSSPATIASKVQSILLPTVKDANMRAALQAFIDCAHTMLASATDEKGNVVRDSRVGVEKVLDALREDGRKAKAAADEFKARGGTIEYHAGDAATFDDAPRGDRVMAVADPPYYLTADYQRNTILGLDLVPDNWSYRATQGLLHKLAEAGDGIVYTDEAWWFKDSYVPDRQDSLFGGGSTFDKEQDILLDVINTLDHFDVAGRVAGRQEVLGIHHGHAIDQESESGTGGDAARPDAADHSGGGQGARPPVLGMAAEPQGQGGRDGATGGERGPDGAGSGAVATRLSISGVAGAERLGIRNLEDAEAMERSGATRLDIWRKTGWWKGKDGKWRIEVGDIRIKDDAFNRLRNRNAKVRPKYNADNLPTPEEIADDPALMDGIELELVAHLAAETTKYDRIHGFTQFVKDEKKRGGIRFLSFDESYDLHLKEWAEKHPELFAVLEESEMLDGPGGVKDSVSRIAAQIKRGDITRGTTKNRARMWWTNYAKKQAVPQTLGELVEGPILDAYPELRNIRIVPWGKSVRNSYAGEAGTNHIAIRMESRNGLGYGPRAIAETIAHEIAHHVQRIEGLTPGSDPESERRRLDRDNTQRARESRTLSAENDLTSTLLRIGLRILERTGKPVDINAIMAQVEIAAATDSPDVGRIVDDIVSGLGENDATQDDAERLYDKVLAFVQAKQQEIHPPSEAELMDDAREAYMAAGGEVEARMVEARLDLTDEQKKEIPPWVTEAVVRQDTFGERTDYSYVAQRAMMDRMTASEVNPSRESFTPIGAGLANESIFAGLLAADYVSGKDRGDATYERLRRALHVEDAGTVAEATAYAREMAEVRKYGTAGRAEASMRAAAAQEGADAASVLGDAPSPDWTAEDYARHYEKNLAARALADAALGGMQEGVKLGDAARHALDQARRNLIREAQGIDFEETIRHGGVDIAATLLGIDPDKFGAWGKRAEEKEEEKPEPEPGPGEPGGRPLTEEEAGQVEAEQQSLDERARRLLSLFKGWKAARESERRKKERQRAEEERRRAERDAAAGSAPAAKDAGREEDEDAPDEEDAPDFTLFSVPLRLLKLCNIDAQNADEMAAFLRILVADYIVSRDATGRLTHETVFKHRPENVSTYRKTMMRMMDELAGKLMDPEKGAALRNVQKHIERIPENAGVDTIERRTAAILRSIQMGAVRRTQADLIRELRRDIHAWGVRGKNLDKMERDADRKINGEREALARYIRRIVLMGPRAIATETKRLQDAMDERLAAYASAETAPGVEVQGDVVYHDCAERLRVLQQYGGLRYKLPAEIVRDGNAIRLWLEKGREEHLSKWEAVRAENDALATAIAAMCARPGRSRGGKRNALQRFADEYGSVCFAERLELLLAGCPKEARPAAERAVARIRRLIAEGSQTRSVLMKRYARDFETAVNAAVRNRTDAGGRAWTARRYLEHLDEKIPDSLSRYLTKQGNFDDGRRGGDARLTYGQALNLLAYLEQTATYADNIERYGREGQAAALRAELDEADLALLSQLRAVYAARRAELSVPVREITGFDVWNPDPLYMPVRMHIPGAETGGLDNRVKGAWNPLAAPLTPRVHNNRDVDESVSIVDAYNRSARATADAIAFGVRGITLRSALARGSVKDAIAGVEGKAYAAKLVGQLTDILTGGDSGEDLDVASSILRGVNTAATYSFLAWNPMSMLKQMTSVPAWAALLPGGFRDTLRYMRSFDLDAFRELCDAPGFVQRYGLDGIGANRARAILTDPTLNWAQKVAQLGMMGLQFGDAVPGFLVGTGLYKAKVQEYANLGESPEEAKSHAATDTWALIEECQQSDLQQNLPELMRRHGVFGRSVIKFANSPLQQLSWEIHAFRVARRTGAKEDWLRAADVFVANHVIMPALMWAVANGVGALLGDDPDDERSWNAGELAVMAILGSFGRVFLLGALAEGGLRNLAGLRVYGNGAMPGTEYAGRVVHNGTSAARHLVEGDYDRAVEALLKAVSAVSAPTRMAVKAVENWGGED